MDADRVAAPSERRRWWSAQAPAATTPISTGRAYLEVIAVFVAFFGSGIAAAGLSLDSRLPTNSGSWAVYGPAAIDALAQAGVAAALVILLCRNRGISTRAFGLVVPRHDTGRWAAGRTLRTATWAVLAFIVGSLVTSALATGTYNSPSDLNAAFMAYSSTAALNAGVVEEMVVLGFVLVTLQQARRPMWEILLVALVLRGSYHIYYGPGVVGIFIWASVFIWLYLRTRSLVPIIAVHFLWDFTVFMTLRWTWVGGLAVLVVACAAIASPITWLVERSDRSTPGMAGVNGFGPWSGPGAWSGPGLRSGPGPSSGYGPWSGPGAWSGHGAPVGFWAPDPSDRSRWRWWDGSRWTDATSG
jgi:membrane protease YdiL (CAAX protease family)